MLQIGHLSCRWQQFNVKGTRSVKWYFTYSTQCQKLGPYNKVERIQKNTFDLNICKIAEMQRKIKFYFVGSPWHSTL